ncbi:MAG: sigma-70 family RNA polymerase sigma factor, partial [Lachnospiraceae bacterium]|nr:sigma-70 family RNA polymerase sigma factor [Lachnospiraceae bacterium]
MMLRDGQQEVVDFLMNKYKNLVRSRAKTMYILGADTEDLIQEGMIGLFKAIRDYDFGRDAGFYTFAQLCISRQIYTAVQASGRKKHMPLNTYISIYSEVTADGENGQKMELSGMLESEEKSPEESMIDRE